ncbi:phage structural protein [Fictibacillus sp. JL2B1089]|uniref:phage structural protein n=1 Tax=Fictibacillus sp. JL2B1089 TaxID=3399565 RepID=UPI003A8BB7CA
METYDPKDVTLTVDGRFITGFAEGSMVECEKDEDNFSAKVDAQGKVSVAISNNPLGTMTVTLEQTSPDVKYLNAIANSKKVVPVWLKGPTEKAGGTQAMIKKPAGINFGDETEDREFKFTVFDYTSQ